MKEIGWLSGPRFIYDMDKEGYYPYTFGGRAGPSTGLSNLLHEVSHAIVCSIDAELERLDVINYALKVREIEIMGELYEETITSQCTTLESRVVGIQKLLHDDLGIPYDTDGRDYYEYWAGTFNFLPDWVMTKKEERMNMIKHYESVYDISDLKYHWSKVLKYIDKGIKNE